MTWKRWMAGVCASAVLIAGCGDDGADSAGGGGAGGSDEKITGNKVIDPGAMDGAKGEVSFCTGKDTSGSKTAGVKAFNKANPGLTVKLIEFPESADEQRNQFVQRQEAKAADCDVFYSDVIWTAEFAQQKWLYDMTPYVKSRADEFIPSTLATITYQDKQWGVPHKTNAGFLYYRTDQVDKAPATWQEVYDVIKSGAAPEAVTTSMEEPARRTFEAGKATFMRNWPYCYALAQEAEKTKGKFAVVPFPAFAGGGKAGILGGANLVISTFSKNPGGALKFIDYMTHAERQSEDVVKFSDATPLKAVYEDPAVKKAQPFSDALKTGVEQAKTRPVSPVYTQVSSAIYKNVNQALSGNVTPEEALKQAQTDMDKALETF